MSVVRKRHAPPYGRDLPAILAVARRQDPADLVLRNGRIIDLVTGEVKTADIAVCGGYIAAIGKHFEAREVVDLNGLCVCPGLIDAHVHVESSMLRPIEYARLVAPHGVTAVIANPHEIANVCGLPGLKFMQEDGRDGPVEIFMTVPSCVPATPLAGSGATLETEDIHRLLRWPGVVALGEVMDFKGVIEGHPRLLAELNAARGVPADGHAPGLSGPSLDAYAAAGISSDHESCCAAGAMEKLRRGMRVFLREGSAARNLDALLPIISPATERFLAFCTDDRDAKDLLREGSIDHLVRKALAAGIPPVTVLRMACFNPAEHYRLFDRGLLAPGRRADLIAFADMADFRPLMVWRGGHQVAREGRILAGSGEGGGAPYLSGLQNTVHIDWGSVDFGIPARGRKVRVIGVSEGQLVSQQRILEGKVLRGTLVADPDRDLLKLAVIERHRRTGRCGLGLVQGLMLPRGAVAGTVAHDHHNLIVAGADDVSMMTAARAVADGGGGLAVALGERVLGVLPLPLAGIMATVDARELIRAQMRLEDALYHLGGGLRGLFMTLSFLGLEVIPELKLTDFGLVDVAEQKTVPLFVDL